MAQQLKSSSDFLKTEDKTLVLKIQSKEGISFNEEVKAISSYNEKGLFDVLPEHENFISIIKDKIIVYKVSGEQKEIKIDSGVLRVLGNKLHIFLGLTNAPA